MGVRRCTSPAFFTQALGSSPWLTAHCVSFAASCSLLISLASTAMSMSPDVGLRPVEPNQRSRGNSKPVSASNHCTVAATSL